MTRPLLIATALLVGCDSSEAPAPPVQPAEIAEAVPDTSPAAPDANRSASDGHESALEPAPAPQSDPSGDGPPDDDGAGTPPNPIPHTAAGVPKQPPWMGAPGAAPDGSPAHAAARPDPEQMKRQDAFKASLAEVQCPEGGSGAIGLTLPRQARDNIKTLISGRAGLDRKVYPLNMGVRTETSTTDMNVVSALQAHVVEMHLWLMSQEIDEDNHPLFSGMCSASSDLFLNYELTEHGIRVEETSENPDVVNLIHAHAQLTTAYIQGGDAATALCHKAVDVPHPLSPEELQRQAAERGKAPERVDTAGGL